LQRDALVTAANFLRQLPRLIVGPAITEGDARACLREHANTRRANAA